MTFGRISASQNSDSVRRMACRSAETAVLMAAILSPDGRLSGGGRGRSHDACRRHDVDARVVVAEDPIVRLARERQAERAVLAESDAVAPPAAEEHELGLAALPLDTGDREEHLRHLDGLPQLELLEDGLGEVRLDAHLDGATGRAALDDRDLLDLVAGDPSGHPPSELVRRHAANPL